MIIPILTPIFEVVGKVDEKASTDKDNDVIFLK